MAASTALVSTQNTSLISSPLIACSVSGVLASPSVKKKPTSSARSIIPHSAVERSYIRYPIAKAVRKPKGKFVYDLTSSHIKKATLIYNNDFCEVGHTYREIQLDILRKNNGQIVNWTKPQGHSANHTFTEILRLLHLCKFELQLTVQEWDGRTLDILITTSYIYIRSLSSNYIQVISTALPYN